MIKQNISSTILSIPIGVFTKSKVKHVQHLHIPQRSHPGPESPSSSSVSGLFTRMTKLSRKFLQLFLAPPTPLSLPPLFLNLDVLVTILFRKFLKCCQCLLFLLLLLLLVLEGPLGLGLRTKLFLMLEMFAQVMLRLLWPLPLRLGLKISFSWIFPRFDLCCCCCGLSLLEKDNIRGIAMEGFINIFKRPRGHL